MPSEINITTWGWIHLILGVVVLLAGICLFLGQNLGQDRVESSGHAERNS
jgi:hypothetical protein